MITKVLTLFHYSQLHPRKDQAIHVYDEQVLPPLEDPNDYLSIPIPSDALSSSYIPSTNPEETVPSEELLRLLYSNLIKLLQRDLPSTSPLRRDIIKALSHGMKTQEIVDLFQISPATVSRLRNTRALLFRMAYRPDATRDRRPVARMGPFLTFINDRIPFASGRNYRIQNGTDPTVFRDYVRDTAISAPEARPFSFTFMHEHLRRENIHHVVTPEFCNHCRDLGILPAIIEEVAARPPSIAVAVAPSSQPVDSSSSSSSSSSSLEESLPYPGASPAVCKAVAGNNLKALQERLEKSTFHKVSFPLQFRSYKGHKTKVSDSEKGWMVVVMDFTQLHTDNPLLQDFILSRCKFEARSVTSLDTRYFHFVADTTENTNDKYFVFGVWLRLLAMDFLRGGKLVQIWSDGGPKHFKIRATLHFFAYLAYKYRGTHEFRYNFFLENHGHCVCDATASHAKKKLKQVQIEENPGIKDGLLIEFCKHIKKSANCTFRNFSGTITGILLIT